MNTSEQGEWAVMIQNSYFVNLLNNFDPATSDDDEYALVQITRRRDNTIMQIEQKKNRISECVSRSRAL